MGRASLLQHQVRALSAIAEAMNSTFSRQEMLTAILRTVVEELGYKAASLRLLDTERKTLVIEATHGLSPAYLDKGAVEVEQSPIDQQVLTGRSVVVHDIWEEGAMLQYPQAARQEGLRSILAVPLQAQGRVIGVLRVYTAELHDFEEGERSFLEAIAHLSARAIANAHLYETFRTIARQVNSTLKAQEVMDRLLRTVVAEMNYKAASIRLLGPRKQRLHLLAAHGLSQAYLAKGEVKVADSPIDRQVLAGRAITLYDVATEVGFQYPEEAAREGIRSVLAVPMRVGDEIIGVLRVYSAQPHRFTQEEVAFVDAIADLGAVALENARLHEALAEKYEAAREDWAGWYRFLALS